jgi:hypothetical protein
MHRRHPQPQLARQRRHRRPPTLAPFDRTRCQMAPHLFRLRQHTHSLDEISSSWWKSSRTNQRASQHVRATCDTRPTVLTAATTAEPSSPPALLRPLTSSGGPDLIRRPLRPERVSDLATRYFAPCRAPSGVCCHRFSGLYGSRMAASVPGLRGHQVALLPHRAVDPAWTLRRDHGPVGPRVRRDRG